MLRRDSRLPAILAYTADDGESFDYKKGQESRFLAIASVTRAGVLEISFSEIHERYRPFALRVVLYDQFSRLEIARGDEHLAIRLRPFRWNAAGTEIKAQISDSFTLTADSAP